MLIVLIGILF